MNLVIIIASLICLWLILCSVIAVVVTEIFRSEFLAIVIISTFAWFLAYSFISIFS